MKGKIRALSLLNEQQETIRVSKDYDRFIPHGLQRIIHSGHVKKIMASMKQWGFLVSHPIAVVKDDAKYRIIDGHHRHAAAKSLGIPLHFVIMAKEYEGMVGDANTGKAWTTTEWARKYTLEGRKHYLTLNKYVIAGVPLMQAAAMLMGCAGNDNTGTPIRVLVSGEFAVRETAQIDDLVAFLREFEGICPAVKTRNFISAFSLCYMTDQFDLEQLRTRLTATPKLLIKTANTQQMLELLETIYNRGSRSPIPLAFIAREAASNRSPIKRKDSKDSATPKSQAV